MSLVTGGLCACALPSSPSIEGSLQVKDKILSLGDAGGNQLYPSDPAFGMKVNLGIYYFDDAYCSRSSARSAIYITLASRHVFYLDVIITLATSPEPGRTSRVAKTCRLDIQPSDKSHGSCE